MQVAVDVDDECAMKNATDYVTTLLCETVTF